MTEGEGSRFSLQHTDDGTRYVEVDTDQNIFDGHQEAEYPRIARDYIKNHFRHTVIGESNNRANVDARTGSEYTNPAKSVPSADFADKMRAATELDNLMRASTYLQHNEPTARHPEFSGGFDLFRTIFKVSDRVFEGVLNIGIDAQGRRRLYDLTQIKSLDPGIWVKQHAGAAAQTRGQGSMTVTQTPYAENQPLGNVRNANASPVTPSISTPAENVNTKFSLLPSTDVLSGQIAAHQASLAARLAEPPAGGL